MEVNKRLQEILTFGTSDSSFAITLILASLSIIGFISIGSEFPESIKFKLVEGSIIANEQPEVIMMICVLMIWLAQIIIVTKSY